MAGCDPCSGLAACSAAGPRIVASGRVVEFGSSRAVAGATVTITPGGGAQAASATTDAAGFWKVEIPAASNGATFSATVTIAHGGSSYSVPGVPLVANDSRGGSANLGRWLAKPMLVALSEVRNRTGALVPGATVTILPRPGGPVPAAPITAVTDVDGTFFVQVPATNGGTMTADVTVTVPGDPHAYPFAARTFDVLHVDTSVAITGTYAVGVAFDYVGEVFLRGSGRRLSGVRATFTRSAGVPITPPAVVSESNAEGRFLMGAVPAGDGTVTGTLFLEPPAGFGAARTIVGISLPTFLSGPQRLAGVWGVGEAARYAGELFDRNTLGPVAGVRVEFHRTGGIPAGDSASVSIANGRFLIAPGTEQPGEVVGDLVLNYRPPRTPEVVHGVRLQTWNDDSLRYLQRWGVGPSLAYQAEVFATDGTPIAGATTEFRRTGGLAVAAADSVVRSTSNAVGRFLVNPYPLGDGEVIGNLTIRPPPPFRDTTIVGVRLPTFLDDRQHLLDTYRLPRP